MKYKKHPWNYKTSRKQYKTNVIYNSCNKESKEHKQRQLNVVNKAKQGTVLQILFLRHLAVGAI